jgi:hypothetical protein
VCTSTVLSGTLVHYSYEKTVRKRQVRPGGGCGEWVRVHLCDMRTHSGYEWPGQGPASKAADISGSCVSAGSPIFYLSSPLFLKCPEAPRVRICFVYERGLERWTRVAVRRGGD